MYTEYTTGNNSNIIDTKVEINYEEIDRLPGRKPGTSSNVMIGMLNASQNRTNRAPFTDAFISKQPEYSQ